MKKSIYQSYDDLPLFLNAELIAKVLGVAPSSAYELMHEKGFPALNTDVMNLLKQNVAAERCAIVRYEEIASFCNNVDYTTCDIAKRIMAEEEEHEQDLQDLLRDVEWIVKAMETKC